MRTFKNRIFTIACTLCLLSTLNIAWAQDNVRLLPVDDADRDLSFVEFRESLREIVKRRDAVALRKVIYSEIATNTSGSRNTVNAFNKTWKPERSDSKFWQELERILSMGGTYVRSNRGVQFCGPYVFTHFPPDLDVYGHGAVTGTDVTLRQGPSLASEGVAKLDYHLVKVNDWRSTPDPKRADLSWIKVSTLDGQTGFVEKNLIRNPTDYHACFLHFSSGWRLISFLTTE